MSALSEIYRGAKWFSIVTTSALILLAVVFSGSDLAAIATGDNSIVEGPNEYTSTHTESTDSLEWYLVEFNKSDVRYHFLQEYNEERSDLSRPEVRYWTPLSEMGDAQSRHMIENNYFDHTRPDGTTVEDRFNDRGLLPQCRIPAGSNRYYSGAENLGMGVLGTPMNVSYMDIEVTIGSEQELADHLFTQWFTSGPHREAMMKEGIGRVGLGLAVNESGYVYASLEMCGG